MGVKMPPLHSLLKLPIIIFPIAMGVGLTGLGVIRLMQATETPASKPLAPYGILAFCSEQCEYFRLNIWMDSIDLKENLVRGHLVSGFELPYSVKDNSSHEVIFGIQIPYHVELSGQEDWVSITAFNGSAEANVDVEVVEKNAAFLEINQTSIIYLKFMTLPVLIGYEVDVNFNWRDLVNKQAFSIYEITLPFALSTHNIAHENFPNVHPLNCTELGLQMRLPAYSDIRDTLPPPDQEVVHSHPDPSMPGGFRPDRYLSWQFSADRVLWTDAPFPISDIIRVRVELLEESELRGRLLFDSGLYLGLGMGLIISGIHEAIKYATEARKVSNERK